MKAHRVFLLLALVGIFGGTAMAEPGEVLLQDSLDPQEALKTLDLYSEESSLGPDGTRLQRVMEGEITVGIPVLDRTRVGRPKNEPQGWEYYSLSLPFTLHRLDGNRYYETAVFQVTMDDAEITAEDLFPSEITTKITVERKLSVLPEVKLGFKVAEGKVGMGTERNTNYVVLEPYITAFGKGQRQFYWEYRKWQDQPVHPGDKQAVVILRVPRGVRTVAAHLEFKAIVVEKVLGVWRKRNAKTGGFPITLKLPKGA